MTTSLQKLKEEVNFIADSMNDSIIHSILDKFNKIIFSNDVCLHQKLRYFKIRCLGFSYYKQKRTNYFTSLENKAYWTNELSDYIGNISKEYKKLQKRFEKCNVCDFCVNSIDKFVFLQSKYLNVFDLIRDYESISNYLDIKNPFIKFIEFKSMENKDYYIPKNQDFERIDFLMEN